MKILTIQRLSKFDLNKILLALSSKLTFHCQKSNYFWERWHARQEATNWTVESKKRVYDITAGSVLLHNWMQKLRKHREVFPIGYISLLQAQLHVSLEDEQGWDRLLAIIISLAVRRHPALDACIIF